MSSVEQAPQSEDWKEGWLHLLLWIFARVLLRKSAINNRKSSIKDDRNRDWLSTGNMEELKNALLLQTHPLVGYRLLSIAGARGSCWVMQ